MNHPAVRRSAVESKSRPSDITNLGVTVNRVVDFTAADLLDLYQEIVIAHPGSRDAEIFEKVRQWTFSDFSRPAHEFAGVPKRELDAWQKRHRINLSAGHIRPERIDVERGHAWGQIRMVQHANRLHTMAGPPSADEVRLAWAS